MVNRTHPGLVSLPPRYPGSFLVALVTAAQALQWRVVRLVHNIALCIDEEGEPHQVEVDNLFRRARRMPREEWLPLMEDYLQAFAAVEHGEDHSCDLEEVKDRLLVRLARGSQPGPDDAPLWSKPLGDTDLVVNLVIDYPNRMCYVTEPLLEHSGKDGDHWLAQALLNLQERTPSDCLQLVHEASGMHVCNVADAYDSSRALLAEDLLGEAHPHGCLVVLPGRDELLILPVTSRSLPHLHVLKLLAMKNFRQAPFPISEEVYWIQGGVWRPFPIKIRAKEVIVQPPEEFVAIMNDLTDDIT